MEVKTSLDDLAKELGSDQVYLFISPEKFRVLGEGVKVLGEKLNGSEALIKYFMLLTSPLKSCYVALLEKMDQGLGMKRFYKLHNKQLINVGLKLFEKYGQKITNQVGGQIQLILNTILKKYRQEEGFSNESFMKSKIHFLHGDGFKPFIKQFNDLLDNSIGVLD